MNCFSKQSSDPPKAADTAAKASTETTSTLNSSIKNIWMAVSSNASSSGWFIDCRCKTHISGHGSMFSTYTKLPAKTNQEKGHTNVISFASGYGSIRLICELPDGKTETIILQEVVHSRVLFNLISQSQIIDKDVSVEPVNHYGLILYNCHGKSSATAPAVDGLLTLDQVQDQVLELTEYTNMNNDSCLLRLTMTGHVSRHHEENCILWHRHLANIGIKALGILLMITDAPRMTGKCNCKSCNTCKLTRNTFTLHTGFRATQPLQLMHPDISSPLETAVE